MGYTVVRPIPSGPVGRSMIAPPKALRDATLTLAKDEVTLYGNRLTIEAAPFCQQDGDFLRCAHASAWMCHYSAARRGLVARPRTASFVAAPPTLLSHERALPSTGVKSSHLREVLWAVTTPVLFSGL